jgi:hypothetical protein
MNRLLEAGFISAGQWQLKDGILNYELNQTFISRNNLYAFVCDGEVKYVGKTTRTLKERMYGYKNPGKTQSTNINNHNRIKKSLLNGQAVQILLMQDSGLISWGPFHLNIAAGLEDSIIRVVEPEWNGGMKEVETAITNEPEKDIVSEHHVAEAMSQQSLPAKTELTFTLQPTYLKRGFFNVRMAESLLLGDNNEKIEIHLEGLTIPVYGVINRKANTNGTPRIMVGKILSDWFKKECIPGSVVTVKVLTPESITIERNR